MGACGCLCCWTLPRALEGGGCAGNSVSHLPCGGFLCAILHANGWCRGVTCPGAALSLQLPASNESLRLQRCQLGAIYRKPFPCSDPQGIAALCF